MIVRAEWMKTFLRWPALGIASVLLISTHCASAQAPAPGQAPNSAQNSPADTQIIDSSSVTDPFTGGNPEQRDREAFAALQQKLKDMEVRDPQQAINSYKQFYETHPNLHPSVAVQLSSTIAQLYYKRLKNSNKALEIYNWALDRFQAQPSSIHLLADEAKILSEEKRDDEIAVLFDQHAGQFIKAGSAQSNPVLRDRADMLKAQGKHDELIAYIQKQFLDMPDFLDAAVPEWYWRYTTITDELLKKKQPQTALSWVKVRFALCSYRQDAIAAASRALSQLWQTLDPTNKELQAFAAAQQDTSKENPLAKVPLPTVDAAAIEQALAHLPQGKAGAHDRISLLLLTGQFKLAMHEAQQLFEDKATSREGALETARVFKAADLNIKRANAFLEFVRTHQGINPVDEFLK